LNETDDAIACYQKALFLSSDKFLQADANNGIGYAYLRRREYNKSIPFFQKAFELNSSYGYAYDNLGFGIYHEWRS
jgi:tetratricopeptide (TPR) repeat protein